MPECVYEVTETFWSSSAISRLFVVVIFCSVPQTCSSALKASTNVTNVKRVGVVVVENVAEGGRASQPQRTKSMQSAKEKLWDIERLFDGAFDRPPWEIHVSCNEQIYLFHCISLWHLESRDIH